MEDDLSMYIYNKSFYLRKKKSRNNPLLLEYNLIHTEKFLILTTYGKIMWGIMEWGVKFYFCQCDVLF